MKTKARHGLALFLCAMLTVACAQEQEIDDKNTVAERKAQQSPVVSQADKESAFQLLESIRLKYDANRSIVPEDECDMDSNWNFEILADLSRAVDMSGAAVLSKLDSDNASFDFKDTEFYRKWRRAVTREWTQTAMESLMAGSEWWSMRNLYPVTWIEFDDKGHVSRQTLDNEQMLGKWSAKETYIEVLSEGQVIRMVPRKTRNYFRSGEAWYYHLLLVSEDETVADSWGMPLVLGPRAGDCGEFNY